MCKLRRVDIERSGEVFEKINGYVREVVRRLDPYRVILFGSFARGDFNEASDVDILVVSDFKEEFLDRIKLLMELNKLGLPLEPVGYTVEEFEEMRRRRSPFILEVLEEGRVLYERPRHRVVREEGKEAT